MFLSSIIRPQFRDLLQGCRENIAAPVETLPAKLSLVRGTPLVFAL